jgi:hypothetical protein
VKDGGENTKRDLENGDVPEFVLRLDPNAAEGFAGTVSRSPAGTPHPFSGWLDLMMLMERLQVEMEEPKVDRH